MKEGAGEETTSGVGLDSVRGHLDLTKCSSSPPDSTVGGGRVADLGDAGFFEDEAALFLSTAERQ